MKFFNRLGANWNQQRGVSLLKRAAKADPKKAPGFYQAAFERFQRALSREPDHFSAHLSWAHGMYNLARNQTPKEQWKSYRKACEHYEQAHRLKRDEFEVLKFWALSLRGLAQNNREKDPQLCYRQAYEKFQQAFAIQDKANDSFYHWALTLYQQSRKLEPAHARTALKKACEKFMQASLAHRNHPNTYNDWGVALLALANLSEDNHEKQRLLTQAHSKCLEAESIRSGFASYNLACIASIKGNSEECRRYLEMARDHLKIPSAGHLENDPDFKNVRKSDWFKELIVQVRGQT
ncbi:MAG: tetratricopeptide repeat protein [Methylococcales bacterium]